MTKVLLQALQYARDSYEYDAPAAYIWASFASTIARMTSCQSIFYAAAPRLAGGVFSVRRRTLRICRMAPTFALAQRLDLIDEHDAAELTDLLLHEMVNLKDISFDEVTGIDNDFVRDTLCALPSLQSCDIRFCPNVDGVQAALDLLVHPNLLCRAATCQQLRSLLGSAWAVTDFVNRGGIDVLLRVIDNGGVVPSTPTLWAQASHALGTVVGDLPVATLEQLMQRQPDVVREIARRLMWLLDVDDISVQAAACGATAALLAVVSRNVHDESDDSDSRANRRIKRNEAVVRWFEAVLGTQVHFVMLTCAEYLLTQTAKLLDRFLRVTAIIAPMSSSSASFAARCKLAGDQFHAGLDAASSAVNLLEDTARVCASLQWSLKDETKLRIIGDLLRGRSGTWTPTDSGSAHTSAASATNTGSGAGAGFLNGWLTRIVALSERVMVRLVEEEGAEFAAAKTSRASETCAGGGESCAGPEQRMLDLIRNIYSSRLQIFAPLHSGAIAKIFGILSAVSQLALRLPTVHALLIAHEPQLHVALARFIVSVPAVLRDEEAPAVVAARRRAQEQQQQQQQQQGQPLQCEHVCGAVLSDALFAFFALVDLDAFASARIAAERAHEEEDDREQFADREHSNFVCRALASMRRRLLEAGAAACTLELVVQRAQHAASLHANEKGRIITRMLNFLTKHVSALSIAEESHDDDLKAVREIFAPFSAVAAAQSSV
jgi:hypothetical protein